MATLVQRNGASLLNELMSWMGSPTAEPEIKVEEYVEDGRQVIPVTHREPDQA